MRRMCWERPEQPQILRQSDMAATPPPPLPPWRQPNKEPVVGSQEGKPEVRTFAKRLEMLHRKMGKNSKKNYLVPFKKSAPISIYPIRTKKSENSGTADHAFMVNRNLNYELSLYEIT